MLPPRKDAIHRRSVPIRVAEIERAPAEVVKVLIRDREHAMEVVVPDDQLSLAIGRRGQNVRLAAQLTGWNIDVYSETRIEQVAARARKVLSNVLGVEDDTAMMLYSHSFRSFEDIASAEIEEFGNVPGIGAEKIGEIHAKAREAVEKGLSTQEKISEMIRQEEERAKVEAEQAAEREAQLAAEAEAEARQAGADETEAREEAEESGAETIASPEPEEARSEKEPKTDA